MPREIDDLAFEIKLAITLHTFVPTTRGTQRMGRSRVEGDCGAVAVKVDVHAETGVTTLSTDGRRGEAIRLRRSDSAQLEGRTS